MQKKKKKKKKLNNVFLYPLHKFQLRHVKKKQKIAQSKKITIQNN